MNQKIKFPRSEKVYLPGTLFPELRVAMRKVEQVPSTNFVDGEKVITPNPEVYVYDTSGPFSDPAIEVDLKKGLPRLREPWILKRGDVEQLPEITSEYGRMRPYSDVISGSCSTSPRFSIHGSRRRGSPFFKSTSMAGSLNGPLVSYTYTSGFGVITFSPSTKFVLGTCSTLRIATRNSGNKVPGKYTFSERGNFIFWFIFL